MRKGTGAQHYSMLLGKVISVIKHPQFVLCAVMESLSVYAVLHIRIYGWENILRPTPEAGRRMRRHYSI